MFLSSLAIDTRNVTKLAVKLLLFAGQSLIIGCSG
jgi:hypothetical protein